ncbi:MAG: RND transporter, partial [Dokdonella sp.]
MRNLKMPALVALSAAIAACTVGPDYVRPDVSTPAHFARAEATSSADVAAPMGEKSDAEFWRGFNDPQLSALVDAALAANHDLRIALANYDR